MKVNFKLLSTFLSVAEHTSFRKAAEQLHLSLPAISRRLTALEEELGVALLDQIGIGVAEVGGLLGEARRDRKSVV